MLWEKVGGRERLYRRKLHAVRTAVYELAASSAPWAQAVSARLALWVRNNQPLFQRMATTASAEEIDNDHEGSVDHDGE
jgi:hypothetical protein